MFLVIIQDTFTIHKNDQVFQATPLVSTLLPIQDLHYYNHFLLQSSFPPGLLQSNLLAGAVGLEPTTLGFGDQCSTN